MIFKFKGGVRCEDDSHVEKFLLFVVAGGEELHLHQAKQHGLIIPEHTAGYDWFKSRVEHVKVFCYESRFGARRMQHNFVIRLDPNGADINLKGFGLGLGNFGFQAKGEVLKRKDALTLFGPGLSRTMLEAQTPLPKLLRKQMLSVVYNDVKTVTRKIRIG